jgi:hypothetical protein
MQKLPHIQAEKLVADGFRWWRGDAINGWVASEARWMLVLETKSNNGALGAEDV